MVKDYYKILEIEENFTEDVLKKKYTFDYTDYEKLKINEQYNKLYTNVYNENEAVLVKFDSRSKFSDLEFSEFLVFKQSKNPSYL